MPTCFADMPTTVRYEATSIDLVKITNAPELDGDDIDRAVDFDFMGYKSVFPTPDGGPGSGQYACYSLGIGTNLPAPGTSVPVNSNVAAIGFFAESFFKQESTEGCEFQIRVYCADKVEEEKEKRPFQGFFTFYKDERDRSALQTQVDELRFHDWMDEVVGAWNLNTGLFNGDKLTFRFARVNTPVLTQVGPDESTYNLPYINDRYEQQVSQPVFTNAAPRTNEFGHSAYSTRTLVAPVADGFGDEVVGDAVTGSFHARFFQMPVTGALMDTVYNNDPSGEVLHTLMTNGGDVLNVYDIGGSQWGMGQKATTHHFVLANYNNLSVFAALDMASQSEGFIATFSGPVRTPSFTVATLPTPTSGLARGLAYATNARNGGEGAGAGTGSTVECTGSIWKIPGIAGAVAA